MCSGIQEALIPPGSKPEAQPQADTDHPAHPAQQSSAAREPAGPAQPEARLEEDAVDRAAAAQLRLAAQSTSQGKVPERPLALEPSSSGPVDAAVAKQSSISTKLAGASVPRLDQGAADAAEANSADSADSSTSTYADAGPASSPGAAPPVEATMPPSTGTRVPVQMLQLHPSRSGYGPGTSGKVCCLPRNSQFCAQI